VEFEVLGPLRVTVAGEPAPIGNARKRRVVLATLLARAGQPVPVDTLVAAVWGDRPPHSARANIQLYVHQLRRALSGEQVTVRGDAYAIDPGDRLDATRFRRLAEAGGAALDAGDPVTAETTLRTALDLWHGHAFGEFLDIEVVAEAASRLELLRLETYERWAEARLATGVTTGLVAELAEQARLHPYRESLCAQLMRALSHIGRRAEALVVFQEIRTRLVDELGVEPGPSLQRLHASILRGEEPPPAAVPSTVAGPLPRQLPAPPQLFTGRVDELAVLDRLPGVSTVVVSAIDGMAGVGKTALAVHAAHRLAGWYPDGQLFIDLHGYTQGVERLEPGEALDRLLRALGVPGSQIPAGLDERAALYRTRLADRRALIVLDNAATEAQVAPLLPGAGSSLVLVTSRARLAGLDPTRVLSLDTLPTRDAVALFQRTAGEQRLSGQPPGLLVDLVELCGGLPLAIRIAAARLRSHPTWQVSHLVERLRDQQRRLAELAVGQRSVTAALNLSYQDLTPDQRRCYRLLGLHPGPDIDPDAAAALIDSTPAQAGRLLDQLLDVHLLLEPAVGRYGFHDLTRAHAAHTAARDEAEPAVRAAVDRLLDYYRYTAWLAMDAAYPSARERRPQVPPAATPSPELADPAAALAWLDTELPNLLAAARYASAHSRPTHVVHASMILLRHLHTRGRYDDAATVHAQAVAAARTTGDQAGQLAALTGLGEADRMRGRYEQAIDHFEQAMGIARAIGDRVGELAALTGLPKVHVMQGRYAPARDQFERALQLARATGDRTAERVALNGLGHIHLWQGRYAQATDHIEQALRIVRATGDRVGELNTLNALGQVHLRQGRYASATDYHQQALRLARVTGNRAGEMSSLTGLGQIHQRSGRYAQAIDHYRQALRLAGGSGDRVGEMHALTGLCHVYRGQGQYARAADHYQQLLALAEDTGDPNYEFEARQGLGRLQHAIGDPEAAVTHHTRALVLAEDLGQPDDQARAHDGLGHAHHALGQLERARAHWQRALEILCHLGVEHTEEAETSVVAIRAHLAAIDRSERAGLDRSGRTGLDRAPGRAGLDRPPGGSSTGLVG
jgi:DNA-binding SARP family transcriptional activator/Flp pilus assembly protein TadD